MKVVEREIKRAASSIHPANGKLSGIEIFFKRPSGDRFRSSSQTGVYFRTFPPELHTSRYSSNKIIPDKTEDLFSHEKKRAKPLRSRDLLSPYKRKKKKKLTMARIERRSNEMKRFLTLFYCSDILVDRFTLFHGVLLYLIEIYSLAQSVSYLLIFNQ